MKILTSRGCSGARRSSWTATRRASVTLTRSSSPREPPWRSSLPSPAADRPGGQAGSAGDAQVFMGVSSTLRGGVGRRGYSDHRWTFRRSRMRKLIVFLILLGVLLVVLDRVAV